MRKIKEAYDYLFYVYYRFWEAGPSVWWSEAKAMITIGMLVVYAYLSVLNILSYFTKFYLAEVVNYKIHIVIGVVLALSSNISFYRGKRWKRIIDKYKNIYKKKNRWGAFIVTLFTLTVVGIFIYSIYLVSTVDWES